MKYLKALFAFSLLFCQLTFVAYAAPQIDSPAEEGLLENGSILQWSANGSEVDQYWVYAGSELAAADYLNTGDLGGAEQAVIYGLPATDAPIYVRLWFKLSGSNRWDFIDSTFTGSADSAMVQITSPAADDVLSGAADTFTWDANGVPVDEWWFYVGTTEGGRQIFDSGSLGTETSIDVTGIPTNGNPVHVRLWYRFNNRRWDFIDAVYTAATLNPPSISSPIPSANISGNSATFTWVANETDVAEWWLYLGSSEGGNQYYDSQSLGTALTVSATGLPEDGTTVYARLWHRPIGGTWSWVDAQYVSLAPDLPPPPPPPPFGDFCEGFISDAQSVVVPQMDKPGYLQPYNDPAFGGRVVRVTDSAFGEVNKPVYSTMQAWNADESLLMIYRTGESSNGGHKLLDGHTYEFKQDLNIYPADLEQVYWSRTDPDKFFYVSRSSADYGKFNSFSVSANQPTEIANFSEYCGSGLPSAGNDVQMHAGDDDLFAFSCRKDDGSSIMLSYRVSTGDVVTAPIGDGTRWNHWLAPTPSASGNSFWHQGTALSTDLQTVNFELDMGSVAEHSSTGMTSDGQDAFYQVSFGSSPNGCDGDANNGIGHLVEHNLETGACRNIISQAQGYPYTTSSTHVSALAYLNPGRVAVSSIGRSSQTPLFTNGDAAPPLFSEIYVAQTDPADTVVCRYAHHRSYGKSATRGGYAPYFGEPHATISPSGTRVIFGSDWYNSGSVDSFVLELPDYVKP